MTSNTAIMTSNYTYSDLTIGQETSIVRVITLDDIYAFAHVSGNLNPVHMPDISVGKDKNNTQVVPSMWLGSLLSAVIGNILPGPGTLYEAQNLSFHGRGHTGDKLIVKVKVVEKSPPNIVFLDTEITCEGKLLVTGKAKVTAPTSRFKYLSVGLPALTIASHHHVDRLIEACRSLSPISTAVVVPEEKQALAGALDAAEAGLIRPILVGKEKAIRDVAKVNNFSLNGIEIENVETDEAAVDASVAMVHQGRVGAIMKGHLHSDDLLRPIVKRHGGLRVRGRRLSHVFVMDSPSLPELLFVTDAVINIAPTLEEKIDITQNAIDLARALGREKPLVGILSAVEVVNPKIPSTLDAAILSKMAERGQIRGGVIDGPLAIDNAISLTAARTKGLHSLVAGRADILVVPNLEAGNILAKELIYTAQAEGAGLVVGAMAPIMLTSRSDGERSRLFSAVAAVLYSHWLEHGESAVSGAANQQTVLS